MPVRFAAKYYSLRAIEVILYPVLAFVVIAPLAAQAAPSDMGSITVTSSNALTGSASGTYVAAGSGATGSFMLTRNNTRGYANAVVITPGNNGIEIRNNADAANNNDSFTYTFAITPDNNNAIHSIKIGQASYTTGGNSEVARHTLSNVTQNSAIDIPSRIYVKDNPSVPFYYEAMGDYFMGSRESGTNIFRYNVDTSEAQVRSNSTNNLYFYKINELAGSNVTGTRRYEPSLVNNEVRFAGAGSRGVLPPTPTFANILKSTSTNPNNQNTFTALTNNQTINGNSYVTYGIENSSSNYVVAVRNVTSITLTYDAIMNGSNAFPGNIIGETFNEWISFGIESAPVYVFSGTVFNDNGGINDNNANLETIGGIYDNSRYFNGIFNPTPTSSPELGIAGSTVRLVSDCNSNNPTVYATSTTTNTGTYQFTVLPSVIGSNSLVCLIETRANTNDYPIRTTTDKRAVSLTTDTYRYPNNNFGRVVAQNAALVLEKEQAANDCRITSLTDSSLAYSKGALSTSETGAGANVRPGMCIAYKITATNRANQAISNFVMQDILQLGNNSTTVTSKLANPRLNVNQYASNSVPIGENGTVVTIPLPLDPRANRTFYFNTQYGSTQSGS